MSDAIDRAAKVIGDILQADPQIAHEMYGDEPDQIARALADAGLLAPAPLREVTTAEELDALITMRGTVVLDCDGNAWQSCSQCSPLWPDANIWMSAITSAY
ncbi:MAG: hypothetical protein U1C73_13955, partial [Dietzia sp.]|nr:hypothetical protein [Dietzia sp.]